MPHRHSLLTAHRPWVSFFASAVLLLCATARAQTFTNGQVDVGDGSSNIFSVTKVGSDGKFYVLWKDGNFVQSVTQTVPRYKLLRWESGTSTWTTVSTIVANTATIPNMYVNPTTEAFTMLSDRFGLRIDNQGAYHIVIQPFLKPSSTIMGAIVYGYSANGSSWTFTKIEDSGGTTNYSFSDPQIDLDQNQRPHILFRVSDSSNSDATQRPTRIRHYAYDGSTWTGETVYSRTGSTNAINGSVGYALDSNGKGHLALAVESNGSGTDASLYYLNNTSGSWSSPENLAAGATSAAAAISIDLAVDANNKVHIVRRDNSVNIHYHTNKSGSWVGGQINGNLQGALEQESLSVNSLGDLFLVYNAQTTTINTGAVSYAYLASGSSTWQTGSIFSGNVNTSRFPSVALNSSRVAMVMFDHFTGSGNPAYASPDNPRQLQYATATMGPVASAPSISSPTSASVAATTATLGGNVTSDGGATITERGVVYSVTTTNNSPAISGTGVTKATGTGTTGTFTVNVTGLTASTGYSYKAYATNSAGTTYTSVGTFTTSAPPDTTPPTVVSVVRKTPSTQNLANGTTTVTFTVTYSEAVTGVAAARFAIENVNGGTVAGTIGTPVVVSTSVYDVPVTITSGSGEFRLKVID